MGNPASRHAWSTVHPDGAEQVRPFTMKLTTGRLDLGDLALNEITPGFSSAALRREGLAASRRGRGTG
jgi:hypothetical protein